jgi:hypothetical protein
MYIMLCMMLVVPVMLFTSLLLLFLSIPLLCLLCAQADVAAVARHQDAAVAWQHQCVMWLLEQEWDHECDDHHYDGVHRGQACAVLDLCCHLVSWGVVADDGGHEQPGQVAAVRQAGSHDSKEAHVLGQAGHPAQQQSYAREGGWGGVTRRRETSRQANRQADTNKTDGPA